MIPAVQTSPESTSKKNLQKNLDSRPVLWRPNSGRQTEALSYRVFELLYGGARGGGKTSAGIAWLTIDIENPKYRALVIRKNADDLADWTDRARAIFIPMGAEIVGKPAEIRFPHGALIRTGHLKDDNAYEKYQGHEYHRMLIEELTQIPEEASYLKLISSCRSTVPNLRPRVFTTTNPGGKGHGWVKARFVDPAPPMTVFKDPITGRGRVYVPATVDDNPILMHSDPSYIQFLEGLPESLKKAWRYGDWNIFNGQYFSEWTPFKHVVRPYTIPDTWKKIRCIDHGRTAPTACMWGAIDYDGAIHWYREYYQAGVDADINAQKIAKLSEGERYQFTVLDSACFSKTGHGVTIAEIYAKNGVYAEPAPKERLAGWNLFHEYLRINPDNELPRMFFFDTCYNAIRTIPMLTHDERKPEDLDSSDEDHCADAISYGLQYLHESKSPLPKDPLNVKLEMWRKKNSIIGFSNLKNFYDRR